MNIGGFLSNDSAFGRLMTKIGTIVVLNILFVISCVPFVTVGPALSALYYSLYELMKEEENEKMELSDGTINPVKVYWKGIRRNFFKSMLIWLAFVAILALGSVNLQVCATWQGPMRYLSAIVTAVMFTAYVLFLLVFPVLSRTEGSIKDMITMAFQTALLSPKGTLGALLIYSVPLLLIRYDTVNQPLYAFIFCFFGCGVLGMTVAKFLRQPVSRLLSLGSAK